MNTTKDRSQADVKDKDRKSGKPQPLDSEHPYKSGERTFSEPDNPPSRGTSPKIIPEQQTGGPNKPTA